LLIHLTRLITCLKWLVVCVSRLESVISLEAFACLEFVAFEPRWISLVERNRSCFCSYYFYLFVCKLWSSSFFWRRGGGLSVEDPNRWGLGFLLGLTGVGHPKKPLSSRTKSVCLSWEINASVKLWIIIWSIFCTSSFVNSNT
jgi:hypothetical protein